MTEDIEPTWYLVRDERRFGPFSDSVFQTFLEDGLVAKTDLVWKQGLSAWVTAEQLFNFGPDRLKPPPLSKDRFTSATIKPPPLPLHFNSAAGYVDELHTEAAMQISPKQSVGHASDRNRDSQTQKTNNYFSEHWHGQLSLPVSFWFNGFLGYLVATLSVLIIGASSLLRTDFSPLLALLSVIGVWTITLSILCWQVVGTWRAATKYAAATSRNLWAATAKLCLGVAVISTFTQFTARGFPQINELYAIYGGDEEVGKYAFRILRNGTELEYSGGITFGAAKEFARFVDAMGALRVVHLNSKGGRIEEAQRIGDLIKKRGLDTFVAYSCLSACTIMFLSGKNRFITEESKVGFHQPSFVGLTNEERFRLIKKEEERLQRLGTSARFARRANETPPDGMWTPTATELMDERIATRIVDGSMFALSGIAAVDITEERADRTLRNIPMYAAIERIDKPAYQRILTRFVGSLQKGQSADELTTQISPILTQLFDQKLPHATPIVLDEYVETMIRHMKILGRDSPAACYFYANPAEDQEGVLAGLDKRFPALASDQKSMKTKVFDAYRGDVQLPSNNESVNKSLSNVLRSLDSKFGSDTEVIKKDKVSPSEYASYCRIIVGFYEEIMRLPSSTRTLTVRKLFSEK